MAKRSTPDKDCRGIVLRKAAFYDTLCSGSKNSGTCGVAVHAFLAALESEGKNIYVPAIERSVWASI
jgi:hypothetical protein